VSDARLVPVPVEEWDPSLQELKQQILATGNEPSGLRCTLANHPALLRRAVLMVNYILFKSTVPPRHRELIILRTSRLCAVEYEWAHHKASALAVGLTQQEVLGVFDDQYAWSHDDATVLKAVDELHNDYVVSDSTWKELSTMYKTSSMMDLVYTVGQYHTMAMAIKSFGVQIEDGLSGFPKQ